jgi:hypothetical protein
LSSLQSLEILPQTDLKEIEMDIASNFERVKKLTEDWPSWKREYQLTKNSEGKHPASSHASTQALGATEHTKAVTTCAASSVPDH